MLHDQKKVDHLKEKYPAGTRIQLIAMSGESDMSSGLMGTVDFVDDIGQIQMTWDNGRSLALVPGEDSFTTVTQQEQVQKPNAPLIGANGNIFNLMGVASRALQEAGMREQADEMCRKVTDSGTYEEALAIIGEYVNVTEADQPDLSVTEAGPFGMKME